MASSQVQDLLRFLSQDAKIPLSSAMGKILELQKSSLTTVQEISKADPKTLLEIFRDEKISKQVLSAAKRVSKKRGAPSEETSSPQKKAKGAEARETMTPFQRECALALPVSTAAEEELSKVVLLTNRAPLVLAFAVCTLKYKMPEQPISSRLSLSQALVSANSRSKAASLGIESGTSAEQEGWGQGQPVIKVLGREIKVLKRWGYSSREGKPAEKSSSEENTGTTEALDDILGQEATDDPESAPPPLWGLDLEALRSAQGPLTGSTKSDQHFPTFTPESARSYLLKSFTEAPSEDRGSSGKPARKTTAEIGAEKEKCLGFLLRSIDMVCRSWSSTLSADELDKHAWTWYLRVRPEVQSGAKGWGEKGRVKLSDVLDLRRQP